MTDGIEVHFDEKSGYLELDCEPGAFAEYRALAARQLIDLPEIHLDRVVEIVITHTAERVKRRKGRRSYVVAACFILVASILFATLIVGLAHIVRSAARWLN